ncbi:MAG TPA: DUF1993 domain-containing protein [Hyphomicrobiales bacterium]|nr:DUF1993 domain-containing protein [Hyphomicrobiales bacterium]
MAISLYDISVANYLQTAGAVAGFLDRGLAHFKETGTDPETIVETSLFPDMRPFRFQIQSVVHQSIDVIDALLRGEAFHPPSADAPREDYAALQASVRDAIARLEKVTPDEVNAREGSDMVFQTAHGGRRYTAPNFILSFSLPNFHFHATTAYDILRWQGVPLGKRDYMGVARVKA